MKKEGWEVKKLGEVCDVRDGTHDSPKYQNEGFPLITSKNLVSGEVNFENVNLISEDDFEKINKRSKVDIGDILMPMIGTIGNPVIVKTSKIFAIKNVALIKFKPSSEVLNRFILSLLKSNLYSEKLLSLNKGGTQKFIALGTIRNFLVPVPSLPIQEQIVAELDTLSDIIYKKREQLIQLDTLAQATFYEMFGDPVDDPKFRAKTFREISSVRQGLQIPISKRFAEAGTNRYPYITNQFINGKKIAEYIENPRPNVICKTDDVLMTRTGNTGIVISDIEGVFHNNFFLIDYDRKIISKKYLVSFLKFPEVKKLMLKKASTTTIPDLNHSDFYSINIPVPPLTLQNQFAEQIEAIEKQKELIEKSITETQKLFDYTMDKYFN